MLHNRHLACILWLLASPAIAGEPDWSKLEDPATIQFYEGLMQPDHPATSCCGHADAYYADKVEFVNGQLVAIITDTRDDAVRNRAHIEPGTRFVVPPEKIRKHPIPNPTGHNLIFIGSAGVYCWEPVALG